VGEERKFFASIIMKKIPVVSHIHCMNSVWYPLEESEVYNLTLVCLLCFFIVFLFR
jgi:hypothetical protein